MQDVPRIHRLLSQSATKETIQRLQRYLQLSDSGAKESEIAVSRGIALRSMEDLTAFLRDDVILVSRSDAEATNLSEKQLREKVAALEAELAAPKATIKRRRRKLSSEDVDHIT